MELDKDDKGRMHTQLQLELWKSCIRSANTSTISTVLAWQWPTQTSTFSPHQRYLPICPRLTSGAGIAQGAADFTLVQVRPRDHQDVGDLAQRAVIRSLAPHLFWGQRAALQGGAARDIVRAGALPRAAFPLPHRPDERDAQWQEREINPQVIMGLEQAQVMQKTQCSAGELKKSITGKPSLSFLTVWVIYTSVHHTTQQEHCNVSSTRAVKGPAQLSLCNPTDTTPTW